MTPFGSKNSLLRHALEHHRREKARRLPTDELVARVQDATREIGIAETTVLRSTSGFDFCDSYLRETRFCPERENTEKDKNKDIGYFKDGRFEYNPVVFSDQRLRLFLHALRLRKVDLKYETHLSTIGLTPHDFWMEHNQERFWIYR